MSTTLIKVQARHVQALHAQEQLQSELEAAQQAYETELEKVLAAHPLLKQRKDELDAAQSKARTARETSQNCRDEAKTLPTPSRSELSHGRRATGSQVDRECFHPPSLSRLRNAR